jgi:hypothetical protein
VHLADPSWAVGWFEAMITNLKLNLTLAYVGGSNADLVASISNAKRQNKSTLFYRWYPDPLVTLVGGVRVAFPDYSMACFDSHDASSVSKSGVTCDLETDNLQSLFHRDLADTDPVLHAFLKKLNFGAEEIEGMLKELRGGGGTYSVDDAACRWVKANMNRWKYWIPDEAVMVVQKQTNTVFEQMFKDDTVVKISGTLVTVFALLLAGFCWWQRKRDKDESIQMSIRSFESVQNSWNDLAEGLFSDGKWRLSHLTSSSKQSLTPH